MQTAIILLIGIVSLGIGIRLGFNWGFKRMKMHAYLQVSLYVKVLVRDGRIPEQELYELFKKCENEYVNAYEKNELRDLGK